MKLSLVFELLLIFVLLAFAASKEIGRHKTNNKGLRNGNDDTKIEDNSLNKYCKCSESLCNCCRDFAVPVVNLNGPGCASLMYLNGDKMSISLSFGNKIITNRTVASRKPSPVCMPLPGGISKFCGRVYNIARTGEEFRACLGLELQAKNAVEAAVRVSCFKFGQRGVTSEPADPLPLVPQDEKETEDEDDDDDDDEEDDFGLGADDDDDDVDADDDDEDEEGDDDDGELDAANDVDSEDYTGFSLLGEDLLGGLFGSTGGNNKKPNKNKNKQAALPSPSTTTRRPRPSRRTTTRRPITRVPQRPVGRPTTIRVRPVNRIPTRRPIRRPTTSAEKNSASITPASSPEVSVSAETQLTHSTNWDNTLETLSNVENIQLHETTVSMNDKPDVTESATTLKGSTSFSDPGLEMSLAHITGQLSVVPVTQIIPSNNKGDSKLSEEQMTYEKVQTITPRPHSTIPFATEVDDDVHEETVQIVHNLDSQSEEQTSNKDAAVDESRGHNINVQIEYEGLSLPKKKHRGDGGIDLEDLDFDLAEIGESVGHELGLFGRNKRNNKNNKNQNGKPQKHKRNNNNKNNDYDYMAAIDEINESLDLPDVEMERRKGRSRQNKMMRGQWL
ncbi:myosin-G heavy chain-like [Leptidea sinapis]|uniref:myosin-G heavy chain-like n=1 Tax=Leptidea sinapis TaxID=189913 RepID=UPI002129AA6F|nr:myosin-G heavy chain-like [Leptidea sinapis]